MSSRLILIVIFSILALSKKGNGQGHDIADQDQGLVLGGGVDQGQG